MAKTLGQALAETIYGRGLVAGGLEVGDELEIGHFNLGSGRCKYTVRDPFRTIVRAFTSPLLPLGN
jgi:hypothetical protein